MEKLKMLNQVPDEAYLDMFDDDDSDSESSDSHDDDISIVVTSDTNKSQKKIYRKKAKNDEDMGADFDKEMENELCDTVNALESVRSISGGSGLFKKTEISSPTTSSQQENSEGVVVSTTPGEGDPRSSATTVKFAEKCEVLEYDDMYFDSDEELEKVDSDKDKKHPVLSNEDLFYDPEMDSKDQMWMDDRRLNPQEFEYLSPQKRKDKVFKKKTGNENEGDSKNSSTTDNKTKKKKSQRSHNSNRRAAKSDAILDCPACMTTLCIDCQKHATFPNQYRAMFVMNCTIDFKERLRYPHSAGKRKKGQVVRFGDDADAGPDADSSSTNLPQSSENDDVYYSVKCDECNTQVAMYDKDEVYHFFNVISSYG